MLPVKRNPFGHARNACLEVTGLITLAEAHELSLRGDLYHKTITRFEKKGLIGKVSITLPNASLLVSSVSVFADVRGSGL